MATKGPYAEIAAAGTTQATAATVSADRVMVTSGTGGVILVPRDIGESSVVVNGINGSSAIDLNVYPPVGGKFNNATANSPLVLPQNKAARFEWISDLNAIAYF